MNIDGLGIFCCLRKKNRLDREQDRDESPDVVLDKHFIANAFVALRDFLINSGEFLLVSLGDEVVIVKSDLRICGSGAALATAPIVQNKAYFEGKIQCGGIWGLGLATKQCDLNRLPLGNDHESWVLRSDGSIIHNGEVAHQLNVIPDEGDIIACTYNHAELYFYINGCQVDFPLTGIKGTVYPVAYVDDGAILDVIFKNFCYPPPDGYSRILFEKSLL